MVEVYKDKLEIFLTDFKEDVQKEILKFFNLKSAEDGNYDILPLDIIEKGD